MTRIVTVGRKMGLGALAGAPALLAGNGLHAMGTSRDACENATAAAARHLGLTGRGLNTADFRMVAAALARRFAAASAAPRRSHSTHAAQPAALRRAVEAHSPSASALAEDGRASFPPGETELEN